MKLSKRAKKIAANIKKDLADLQSGKLVLTDKNGHIVQIDDYLAEANAEFERHDRLARFKLNAC